MTKFYLRLIAASLALYIASVAGAFAQNACIESGTLLFFEDFGGNEPSDPMTSPTGIGTRSEYVYQADLTNYGNFGNNKYTITKQIPDAWRNPSWMPIDDHTYWNDIQRGYCFLVNGDTKKKVYELQIDGLCAGSKLYFSLWAANICKTLNLVKPDLEFIITDLSNTTVASYRTGENIPETATLLWKQYGINIDVPSTTTSLIFKVISHGNGGGGNDYVIDDIAVHLCTNAVDVTANEKSTAEVFINDSRKDIEFAGKFINDGKFGGILTSYWLYSKTGDLASLTDWTVVSTKPAGACATGATWTHDFKMTDAKPGYYRLAIGNGASVLTSKCRAASKIFRVQKLPDNIINPESDCVDNYGTINFEVKQKWASATNTSHNMSGTLVGDIVGDGIPVVISYYNDFTSQTRLNVLDGVTGATLKSIVMPIAANASGGWNPIINAVLIDSDNNGKGEIIVARADKRIISYEVASVQYNAMGNKTAIEFNEKWDPLTTVQFTNPTAADPYPHINVCDFNGDGKPELLVYGEIYAATTGKKIGNTRDIDSNPYMGRSPLVGSNKAANFQTTIDMDGDGLPEIVAGGKIYKVTINPLTGMATCSLLHNCTAVADGYTAVADIDMDGQLEVVVINTVSGKPWLHIWRPVKGTQVIANALQQTQIGTGSNYYSFPFIGDIDGYTDPSNENKKYPEICVNVHLNGTNGQVKAFKYNSATKQFVSKWTLLTTDTSGGTTLTLFDFDNDNVSELVYRDQSEIKIYNGVKDNTTPVLAHVNAHFTCTSSTAYEYPSIADIDGDGNADICVSCGAGIADGKTSNIRTYESAGTPWAPTRKVWNQVSYEPTLINNDLTITKNPIAKHTQFSVKGEIHTPYNGSLIQVATVDTDFEAVVYAPDPYIKKIQATWVDKEKGIIQLSVVIGNDGAIRTNSGLPITLYKGGITGEIIGTKLIGIGLAPGKTTTIDFIQMNVKDLAATYTARVQDNGITYPVIGFLDCTEGNNTLLSTNLFLNDDYLIAYAGVETNLKVVVNDVLPTSCAPSSILTIKSDVSNGVTQVLNTTKIIKYTSSIAYEGEDELIYQIQCGTNIDTAKVKIKVVPKPNNIDDAECFVTPPKQEWKIKPLYSTSTLPSGQGKVFDMDVPLVGNIDNDANGEIEIIAASVNHAGWHSKGIKIFKGKDGSLIREFAVPSFASGSASRSMADMDGDGKAEIVIAHDHHAGAESGYVTCYDLTTGNRKWISNAKYTDAPANDNGVNVQIADINADGKPEILVGEKIYNHEGILLLDLKLKANGLSVGLGAGHPIDGAHNMPSMNILADMDGVPGLELVAGNNIYKININNTTGTGSNSRDALPLVSAKSSAGTVTNIGDGFTTVADINLDEQLDVITLRNVGGHYYLYVWDGKTGEVLHSNTAVYMPASINGGYGPSIPFVGDLDGDGYPEICYTGIKILVAYKFNPVAKTLNVFWKLLTTDGSGSTTLSMFDFNQDGKTELVYRDEKTLRIINGSLINHITGAPVAAPYTLDEFNCATWTMNEYPVIADVTGEKQANIVVFGKPTLTADGTGYLNVYAAGDGTKWAPARSVWNQYAYNAVNVNDDLTIPKFQLNPATRFPGKDGQLDTADDTRPYNGYLMQQTRLSRDGAPLFLTPNAKIDNEGADIKFSYNTDTDILTISNLKIDNTGGDAMFGEPIKITIYKNSIGDPQKYTHTWAGGKIAHGTIGTVPDFEVPNFKNFLPNTNLQIRINDNGSGQNYLPVCDSCCVTNASESFVNIPYDAMGFADKYKHCPSPSSTVTLTGTTLGGTPTYHWTRPDGVTEPKTGKTVTYNLPSLDKAGQYVLTAKNIGIKGDLSVTYKLPYLSVAPTVMYWKSNAGNKNWNDLTNWLDESKTAIKAVPAECTTVHIPAVATNYPSFQENTTAVTTATDYKLYGQPEVDAIVYHFGAETAYPHRLKYNKAYVQYNFGHYNVMPATGINQQANDNSEGAGASKLNRNQWYALATPIKDMASGDFSFGGYPFTWQAAQNLVTGTSGRLTSLNFDNNNAKNNVRLSDHHNVIGIKVAPFSQGMAGYSDHRHLQSLKGVLEIPYMDNESQKGLHPAHSYDPISKTSSFFYFDNATLQQLASPVDTMKRGEGVFKFVFDGAIKNMTVNGVPNIPCYLMEVTPSDRNYALIGNPFMAIINMENFKKANAAVLKATNNKYQAYVNGVWTPYDYTANNGVNSLQAFAIELKDNNKATLTFPLEGDWALTGTATNKIPRRLEILGAIAVTAGYENGAQAGCYAELVSDQMTGAVRKLISQEGHVIPEVFFIDQTGNDFNLIHVYEQGISEVGLGVKCSDTKNELVLSFDHIGEFAQINNTRPVLVDKLLGVEQDLIENSSYRFRQLNTANVQSQYADMKRFAIRFNEGFSANNVDNLQVIYTNGHLEVKTTVKAVEVGVYSLSGQLLFNSGTISATNYHQDLPLAQGGYIVKVKTENNKSTSKKIMAW